MRNDSLESLKKLCEEKSKHSGYQHIHPMVLNGVGLRMPPANGKAEESRQEYFDEVLRYKDRHVVDIGANTGYFSFSAIEREADRVTCYEGNSAHANFLRMCADLLDLDTKLEVLDRYYDFDVADATCDICLCLNVLHHLGDDFDNPAIGKEQAKRKIVAHLQKLSEVAPVLVLQLGFNWKGNRNTPLFETGQKREMIEFVRAGVRGAWNVASIAAVDRDNLTYRPIDETNIGRFDELGEFLNRPIFVLESLRR